jgi:hypothetical protein
VVRTVSVVVAVVKRVVVWFVTMEAFQYRVVMVWLLTMLVAVTVLVSVIVGPAVSVAPPTVVKVGQPTIQSHAEVTEVLAYPEMNGGQGSTWRFARKRSTAVAGRGNAVGSLMVMTRPPSLPGATSRPLVVVVVCVVYNVVVLRNSVADQNVIGCTYDTTRTVVKSVGINDVAVVFRVAVAVKLLRLLVQYKAKVGGILGDVFGTGAVNHMSLP